MCVRIIDTHAHLDGEEYAQDLAAVIARARQAGISKIFLPAINEALLPHLLTVAEAFPDYLYPMIGLHPEEVKANWQQELQRLHELLAADRQGACRYIAVGEIGLDYYWSREFEGEQLAAFEQQVAWAAEFHLPLMIHCRKAQNELVKVLHRYEADLVGGVFHCFTGNVHEAEELLSFQRFCLGIGGVLTFKSSHLREDLPAAVPLQRIVLETDSPYMAPVPYRGKRNESAYVVEVMHRLAEAYGVTDQEVAQQTTSNVQRLFPAAFR